ncbi:MAG TPA: VOC family protein [Pyrinomonadaceae bacterium]|nr:VOC family protein [Pyrinomonadaceae bacterium]
MIRIAAFLLALLLLPIAMNIDGEAINRTELLTQVDHLVYATPDLNRGIGEIEQLTGVRASPGGQHPGGGTRNALVALGPTSYLEIIGPDPDQPAPKTPRSFGIDGLKHSRLATWAAKGNDLDRLKAQAELKGVSLTPVSPGSRKRPDGVMLSWRTTRPVDAVGDGIVPFFIDWGQSPHPSQTAAPGLTLIDLRAEHPDATRVQQVLSTLGLDLQVKQGANPGLVAIIKGPKGTVELR